MARGRRYEEKCAARMRRSGFSGVVVTKRGHDQGIDIIGYRHHRKYGVQCKFYDGPVGNKAVQEARTGREYYGCDKAAVVTNSTFTVSARKLAEAADVQLWEKNRIPGAWTRHCYFTRIMALFWLIPAAVHLLPLWNGSLTAFISQTAAWPALLCLIGCLFNILDGWKWNREAAAFCLHAIWAFLLLRGQFGMAVFLMGEGAVQKALILFPAVCSMLRMLRLKAAARIRREDREI